MSHGFSAAPAAGARYQRGFGLIEVAIAIVVLSIGILGLAALVPMGTKSASKSGEVTRASEMASALAEKLLATPYGDPSLSSGAHQSSPYPAPGGYYLTYVVEDDEPITLCKRVTIQNHWPTASSPNRAQLVIVCPRANSQ